MSKVKTYTIKEAADILGVSKSTLQRWERKGWIDPPMRDFRGWRAYTDKDIKDIRNMMEILHKTEK